MKNKEQHGFTLIELLIVVLIIAILAAIAVPNFLEFQTRAKCSRVHNDLRNLAVAMEAYCVDDGNYIPHVNTLAEFNRLTTPIAYLSTTPQCPFAKIRSDQFNQFDTSSLDYHYEDLPHWGANTPGGILTRELASRGQKWIIWSIGPDIIHNMHSVGPYDPTNGATSLGDLYRSGP
jgi:prepilin-type N-terminal cleavage/methylation domain-containing protein